MKIVTQQSFSKFRMKNLLIAGALACVVLTSCEKETFTDIVDEQTNNDQLQRNCQQCKIIAFEDYSGNAFTVAYKNNGNPDTINDLNYGTIKLNYGPGGKLTSANFLQTGANYQFYYRSGSNEPSRIIRSLGNGIVKVDSFFYSYNGNMIKYVSDGITAGQSRIVYNISYNSNRNVTQSYYSLFDAAGNLVTAYTENTFSIYDNKPNYINNKWLKYVMIHTGINAYDVFKLWSKNNPVNYTINDGVDIYNGHSAYSYTDKFVNTNEMQLTDQATGTVTFSLYEFAGSTCDVAPLRHTSNGNTTSKLLKSSKKGWLDFNN